MGRESSEHARSIHMENGGTVSVLYQTGLSAQTARRNLTFLEKGVLTWAMVEERCHAAANEAYRNVRTQQCQSHKLALFRQGLFFLVAASCRRAAHIARLREDRNGTNMDRALSEELSCGICLCELCDPRFLSCLHSFCRSCLDELAAHSILDTLVCPQCRAQHELSSFEVAALPADCRAVRSLDLLHASQNQHQKGTHASLRPPGTLIAGQGDGCPSRWECATEAWTHAGRDEYAQGNFSDAVYWWRKAAQSDPDAQCMLGRCYEMGLGVSRDARLAVELFQEAAGSGNTDAQLHLARCYENGNGISQDYARAVRLFGKAVVNGSADAKFYLARCYESGHGVAKNKTLAKDLYRDAADCGCVLACIALDVLESGQRQCALM
ncbi:protein YbeQ [Porphyridium purpureum]|uniref:Protein YbeQ n=1 Tax=Porphyridium purpureum TaxID=35688 RepID=A0A5J4Z788_PORPP|nr:protein YbeQ [Porphyridium purpureum]|eukprot:POR6675..scf295_1